MTDLETAKRVAEVHCSEPSAVGRAPRQTWAALVDVVSQLRSDLGEQG